MDSKFRRSGVLTLDSFSRPILKVCVLGRVETRYWKSKIVFRLSTNTTQVELVVYYPNTDFFFEYRSEVELFAKIWWSLKSTHFARILGTKTFQNLNKYFCLLVVA